MLHTRNLAEAELHERAREEIQRGRLPDTSPESIWAGPGSGLPCSVCGDPIQSNQVEYEMSLTSGADSVRFHLPCHTVWQLECDVTTARSSSSPWSPHRYHPLSFNRGGRRALRGASGRRGQV